MIKTQAQIPDDLYRRAKQVAAEKKCSLAEVVRRGLEYITPVNPSGRPRRLEWKLPKARPSGPFRAPAELWTELAHEI